MLGLAGPIKYIAIAIAIGIGIGLLTLTLPVMPIIIYMAILFNVIKLFWEKIKSL